MDNKIFSAFQLTVLTISTLVYYIIKIMSINFLQPLSWLWFTPFKSLTMPLKRWMEMNVLERVQGSNRITAQGHREIEEQRVEGKRWELAALRTGRRWRRMPTAPRWRVQLVPPWEGLGRDLKWRFMGPQWLQARGPHTQLLIGAFWILLPGPYRWRFWPSPFGLVWEQRVLLVFVFIFIF